MRMRLACLTLALAFAAGPAGAHSDGMSFTTNVDDDQAVITCADIDMQFWKDRRGDLVTSRRDRSVPVSLGSSPLRVVASRNGGIRVQAATGSSASAVLCMAAGAKSEAAAAAILDMIEIVNRNGELTVHGPDTEDWGAFILLSIPKDAALDLEAENGSLAMHGVTGNFTLRTTNGPIHLAEVFGKVDGEAVNGPIHYRGHGGDVRLRAQNGPIGVNLDAATWTGKGLTASTQNGHVDFTAPPDLRTGVEVEGSEHSPFHWKSIGDMSRASDGDHTLRLGSGPVLVRLSTVNGPVSIKGGSAATRARSAKGVKI